MTPVVVASSPNLCALCVSAFSSSDVCPFDFKLSTVNPGFGCFIDGAPAQCGMAYHQLANGTAAVCPNGDCTGLRFQDGPGGVAILQKWIAPRSWTTGDETSGYVIHFVLGYWENVGVLSDQSGDGWWSAFFQDVRANFWNRLLSGNRNQAESFSSCVFRNADETTGGQHSKVLAAATFGAYAAWGLLQETSAPGFGAFGLPQGSTINIALRTSLMIGRGLAAAGAGSAVAVGATRVAAYGLTGATYAGTALAGAEAGLLIGSAINCR